MAKYIRRTRLEKKTVIRHFANKWSTSARVDFYLLERQTRLGLNLRIIYIYICISVYVYAYLAIVDKRERPRHAHAGLTLAPGVQYPLHTHTDI